MAMLRCIVAFSNETIFKDYLLSSLQKIQCQLIQVKDDVNQKYTIFQKYNMGIEGAIRNGLIEDDIVVFAHEDIKILDNLFIQKINMIFNEKKNIGMIGIAGTSELDSNCAWWNNDDRSKLVGHLMQETNNNPPNHLVWGVGFFDNVVCVDGCALIVRGKCLLEGLRFDTLTYPNCFDFYDIDFSMQMLQKGWGIAVADTLIQHKSMGMGALTDQWKQSKELFVQKWANQGIKFPITRDQFKIKEDNNEIIEIEI